MLSKIKLLIKKVINIIRFNRIKKVCNIHKNAFIYKETQIVNCTNIKEKMIIGSGSAICGTIILYPVGHKITIGTNCYIGDHTRIWVMGNMEIGDNVLIAHNVNIIDNNSHSTNGNSRKNELKYILSKGNPKENIFNIGIEDIKINNGAWIGMNSIILKGVEIGENSIVAAGSVVTKNVPPNSMVAGNPAKFIKILKQNV